LILLLKNSFCLILNTKYYNSPLTKADLASHDVIMKELKTLTPDIPIISEEGRSGELQKDSSIFWLVDPLDGTKEFIKRNGEFTANIALIEDGQPILGVVYAPARDVMYVGAQDMPARKRDDQGNWQDVQVAQAPSDEEKVQIVASRSHGSDLLDVWLSDNFDEDRVDVCGAGSSLKLCLVAEGKAHFYPRFGRTMEWDIAAGQAVLLAAGGCVTIFDESRSENLQPLIYGKEGLDNPHFIASSMKLREQYLCGRRQNTMGLPVDE